MTSAQARRQLWPMAGYFLPSSPLEGSQCGFASVGDQHVFDAAILQFVHDAQPEFGALILLEPQDENFLGAVGAHAERDVHRLVADPPFIPDLDPQGSKNISGIDCLQGAGLPGCDRVARRHSRRRQSLADSAQQQPAVPHGAQCTQCRTAAGASAGARDH